MPIGKAPVAWLYAIGEAGGRGRPPVAAPAAEGSGRSVRRRRRRRRSRPKSPSASRPWPATRRKKNPRATPKARRLAREGGLVARRADGQRPARGACRPGGHHQPCSRPPRPGRGRGARPLHRRDRDRSPSPARRAGTGTPVVLLHGFWQATGPSWDRRWNQHLRHRPLIRIELPAHGKSPKLRIADFAALAAEYAPCLRRPSASSAAHLVGPTASAARWRSRSADTRERKVDSLTLIAPRRARARHQRRGTERHRPRHPGRKPRALAAGAGVRRDAGGTPAWVRSVMAGRDSALRAAQEALAEVLFPRRGSGLRPARGPRAGRHARARRLGQGRPDHPLAPRAAGPGARGAASLRTASGTCRRSRAPGRRLESCVAQSPIRAGTPELDPHADRTSSGQAATGTVCSDRAGTAAEQLSVPPRPWLFYVEAGPVRGPPKKLRRQSLQMITRLLSEARSRRRGRAPSASGTSSRSMDLCQRVLNSAFAAG